MEAIVPYLNFKGTAKAAFDFYAKALNGEILFAQTFGESPMEVTEENRDKIMHATLKAGNLTIMASDVIDDKFPVIEGTNVSLSMNFTKVEDIDRVFAAMSEGSNITMPLQDTFWGAKFGMLTDAFGINWMFNHDYEQKDK
ncbi:VOC family protein [Edaphocola aurantiacus]|uniref:VOC family protein n=1 Tax=Edaphocola aurantiacus TaxID=2601682 RepID=UPI001C9557D7|nr:glyoxalase/bleomycin resistance/extradiol dioxygenase family protein [Edaphocola aurantiacus]